MGMNEAGAVVGVDVGTGVSGFCDDSGLLIGVAVADGVGMGDALQPVRASTPATTATPRVSDDRGIRMPQV